MLLSTRKYFERFLHISALFIFERKGMHIALGVWNFLYLDI